VPARAHLRGFGPGKVILLGEHGVVYGFPALAGPLPLGVEAEGRAARSSSLALPSGLRGAGRALLTRAFARAVEAAGRPNIRVTLRSDLPTSMGLGSSAAVSVACAQVLLQAREGGAAPGPARVAKVAWEMEQVFHGTPSGVDHTCAALGTLIHFRRRPDQARGTVKVVQAPVPVKVVVLLVGERPATKQTVAALRERQALWPERYARVFREIGALADEGRRAVEAGDLAQLGDLMNMNQGLLAALGLSSAGIDEAVHRLRAAGALGAKLTGAGGDGGAVVGLFPEPGPIVARLRRAGLACFASQLAGPR
jgi:mevalonate kinase